MNTPKEDDASIDAATATTNVEPSSTTSATSSLFPAAVVAIGQNSRRDNAKSLVAAAARGNVEIIEDEDGPLLPPAMSAVPFDGDSPDLDAARTAASRHVGKPAKAWPEEIKDNTGPDIPVSTMEFTDSKKMEPIVTRPTRPVNIAEIGDEADALKKGQPPPRQQLAREDSIVIPPSEDMDDDDLRVHTNRRGGRAEEYIANANVAPSNSGVRRDQDEEANVRNGNPEDALARPDLEQDSTFRVPEAVLVEEVDDEVYMGEPIEPPLPWWKQRRTRMLLCLMFVIVAISAITSGLSLSSEGTDPIVIVVVASNAPSSSTAPSSYPSISTAPSISPTQTFYCITIAIDYDEKPEEINWNLYRVSDDYELVKRHFASQGDTSYSESICLEEGEYDFTIYDSWSYDGICCDDGEGSYNVTVDGTLIVEGGEFGYQEATSFSLPFVAGTNETTQWG